MKLTTLATLLALTLAAPAVAQVPTGLDITFYRTGATTPAAATFTIPLTSFTCNQPVVAAPPVAQNVNPRQYRFPDLNDGTRDCVFTEPVGGPLTLLPIDPVATYFARAMFRNGQGVGPSSVDSNPFSRPGTAPTAAPGSFRLLPGL